MIEKRIKYYCTDCEIEYDDKESISVCTNHPDIELCEECKYVCDGFDNRGRDSGIGEGCHKWFCEECIRASPFDAIYPAMYCKDCVERLGIDSWNYSDEVWENEYSEEESDRLLTLHDGPNKFYTKWKESQE